VTFIVGASSNGDPTGITEGLRRLGSKIESPGRVAAFAGLLDPPRGLVLREWRDCSVAIHGSRSDEARLSAEILGRLCAGEDPESAGLSCASVAVFNSSTELWELHADLPGVFPLYYASDNGCFWFSTRLRPLASALNSSPDPVGIVEFVRLGYTIGSRTRFEGIRRLLPGQRLRVRKDGSSLVVSEHERRSADDEYESKVGVWNELREATARQLSGTTSVGLMTSGGWDSRLLLTLIGQRVPEAKLVCYSYGDPASRELRIADRLAELAGAEKTVGGLGPELLDVDRLKEYSNSSDTLLFPHWRSAGARLREEGCDIGVAGVLGEILGGHYGPPYYYPRWRKASRIYRMLLGLESAAVYRTDLAMFWQYFLPGGVVPRPRSISLDWWNAQGDMSAAIREDLAAEVERIKRAGIVDSTALLERFTGEHRGARYQVEQLRALGTEIDAGSPYIDSRSVRFLREIPFRIRAEHGLASRLLADHGKEYAALPLSSTLLPAAVPTVVRELSRGARAGLERAQMLLHIASRGRLSKPNYSYVDFSFVGDREVNEPLLAALRADYWDRGRLSHNYSQYESVPPPERPNLHSRFDQLLKNLTVEWDLLPCTRRDDDRGAELG
jgi:hypothetical protein